MIEDGNVTFGAAYKDDVTGFAGKATAHCRYQDSDSLVRLESKRDDGALNSEWFPIKRLSFAS